MEKRTFHLQNLTALHVGTGQGVGIVDLPISRAKASNLPIVAGSAIKGVLRDELTLTKEEKELEAPKRPKNKLEDEQVNVLFGPYSENDDNAHAGAIAFGDANLLLFPIRSFAGTVAYATCPYILRQYKRDMELDLKIPSNGETAGVVENSSLFVGNTSKIALEDLDIDANHNDTIEAWAKKITEQLYPETESVKNYQDWREQVIQRFVVLPDNLFSFLADTATEIRTRIRIDRETRVVKDGALWTEENLPADSVLWGVIGVSMSRKKDDKRTAKNLADLLPTEEINIQVGGKHTVGRGLCRLLIADNTANKQGE